MDEIETKKVLIEQSFSNIEQKIETFDETQNSEKDQYIKNLENEFDELCENIQHFSNLIIKNGKRKEYSEIYDNFDEKLIDLEDSIKNLEKEILVDTVKNISTKNINKSQNQNYSTQAQEKIDEGNNLLEEGKSRIQNAQFIMKRIEDNLDLIEDEIESQRQKLLKTKDLIKDSQNLVKRAKQAVYEFSKLLQKDKWIKFLIILITILIFVILAGALKIKWKRVYGYKRGKEKLAKFCLDSKDFEYGYWQVINEDEIHKVDEFKYFDHWNEKNWIRIERFKKLRKKYKEFNRNCLGLKDNEVEL